MSTIKYADYVNPRRAKKATLQTLPIPGCEDEMSKNSAGGYSFSVTPWQRLDRFLILGSESNTYYTSAQKLTVDNAKEVQRCIDLDGLRVVSRVVEVSCSGRAPRNDQALFVLAMCAAASNPQIRAAAMAALPSVARIGTHLFHFAEYAQAFRGWGRALKRGVSQWYSDKSLDDLVFQMIKYKSRDGWSHRDLLRLAHVKPVNVDRSLLYRWAVDSTKVDLKSLDSASPLALRRLAAAEQLSKETNVKTAVVLIKKFSLPREVVNTQLLNEKNVWSALLENMPMTAMIRNLAKMTSVGLLSPLSKEEGMVVGALGSVDVLRKSRVHPIQLLSALTTYKRGEGVRGSLAWTPNMNIVNALDKAFYDSFQNVESTGKRIMIALDISGSMVWSEIAGVPGLNPRVASTAMAMVTMAADKQTLVKGFSSSLIDVNISARQRLDDALVIVNRLPFGGTDCSLPMVWALKNKVEVDTFIVYTDNETWAGRIHPSQALQEYRNKMKIPAKLIVVGMAATGSSIADPKDRGMLDVVGFDASAPSLMSDFIKE
jgi:60 kDa SS-A/Ro ribonucleoprotein